MVGRTRVHTGASVKAIGHIKLDVMRSVVISDISDVI